MARQGTTGESDSTSRPELTFEQPLRRQLGDEQLVRVLPGLARQQVRECDLGHAVVESAGRLSRRGEGTVNGETAAALLSLRHQTTKLQAGCLRTDTQVVADSRADANATAERRKPSLAHARTFAWWIHSAGTRTRSTRNVSTSARRPGCFDRKTKSPTEGNLSHRACF
jgi:hypothetical protein